MMSSPSDVLEPERPDSAEGDPDLPPHLADLTGACRARPIDGDEAAALRSALFEGEGIAVVRSFLKAELVEAAHRFWSGSLATFRRRDAWIRCAGSKNFMRVYQRRWRDGRTDTYRRFNNFWWNPPDHPSTYDLLYHVHALRNRLCGHAPGVGLREGPVHSGTCFTVNHYPPGARGVRHRDGDPVLPVVFVLPLSFRGSHYQSGGLCVWDRAGRPFRVDEEAGLKPGDVVFYHGLLPHSIEPIDGKPLDPARIRWSDRGGRWVIVSHPQRFGPRPPRWVTALSDLRVRMNRIFNSPLVDNPHTRRIWRLLRGRRSG